ncbi:MarR family transcriptional regulator [SAR202 cluster bacterium JH639]|nr:MarR family transcriptional regulator [SAR202 cluster bacterium JH639]
MTSQTNNIRQRRGIRGNTSFRLSQVSRLHRKRASELLSNLDLHLGQEMVLDALWTFGELSQTELAEKSGVRKATMTVALRPLEKCGLVERTCDPNDRRVMLVAATAKSQKLRHELYDVWEQLNRETIADLTNDERKTFDRLLKKVRLGLESQ